jgi:septum formation protein
MLRSLRNREHRVLTGLSVIVPASDSGAQVVTTRVQMRDYADAEIAGYVQSGDAMDKAGAYAIQHAGFRPIARIDGCYANVMGLPMCHLYLALCAADVRAPVHPLAGCPYAQERGCVWADGILSQRPAPPSAEP